MDNSRSMVEMHSSICEDIAGNSTNISPKRQIVRFLLSPKIEYLLYKPPYLTGIEGPPPKVVLYQLPYGEK